MKKCFMLPAALLLLFASCVREEQGGTVPEGDKVTIRVSMPEETFTKVSFTDDGSKLALAWEDTDCLRVISGENSEVYTISSILSDHEAEFTGPAVAGSSFDILFPGTYSSVAEAEADTESPAQTANGSTSHLKYKALLQGVDSYTELAFKSSWASAHGGTLKQAAAVKLQATLPGGVTAVKKAGILLGGENYTLPLSGVDVSASGQVLTAYLMLPWEDIALAGGSKVQVYVLDADNEAYGADLTISGDKTILQGKMNSLVNVNLALKDFVAGDGSVGSPYLIANARQLENMMKLYRDSEAPADATEFKKWFRLLEDVSASGITWTPINNSGSFYKAIDFNGDGHTISALTVSGTYSGFCGVLYGTVRNVTFDGASVSGSTKKGVVAGFLGTDKLPGSCENVIVKNSTVSGNNYSGGFAGHIRTTGTITSCSVLNTSVTSGSGIVGGFAAEVDLGSSDKYDVPCIFTDCHVSDVTITQNYASNIETLPGGGFIGKASQAASFKDCTVKATITATKAAIRDIGGFVGRTTYAGSNFNNCHVLAGSSVSSKGYHTGGFVGYAENADSYVNCSSAAEVSSTTQYTGGFVGYASGASSYKECSAGGNVTGAKNTGGFAGYAENSAFVDCCYEDGTITDNTSGQAMTGGFCGYPSAGVSFRGCYVSNATVTATNGQRCGGFAGQFGSNSNKGMNNNIASQCHVDGITFTAALNSGGFVGVQYSDIENSYVTGGTITARGNNCGGFSGFVDTANLTNCYSTASVAGGSYSPVGGFIGIEHKSNVSFCYAAGSISGSGTNKGAFVGQIAASTAVVDKCIGWHETLPFYGATTDGASLTDTYAGASGTVSSRATDQTWPAGVWNLGGALPTLLDVPRRINAVFVGDSITWQWARNENTFATSKLKIPVNTSYMSVSGDNVTVKFHPGFFSGNGYVDKGISGQQTKHMLSRFRKDVIDLNPVVVVIMAGTNDLANGVTKETIVGNIAAMAEMADAAGIKVILCSVTPNNDSYSRLSDPKTKGAHIITLNGMISSYAASKGFTYCDYWTSLVADDGYALNEDYRLYDNLHPGPDGYDVMEPIIKTLIDALL